MVCSPPKASSLCAVRWIQRKTLLNHPQQSEDKMPIDLPYAADAEVSLSYDELIVRTNLACLGLGHVDLTYRSGNQVLQRQYEKEQELGHVTSQSKFNYAWALVKSPNKEQQVEGIGLLQGMIPAYLSPNRSSDSGLILGIRFVPYGAIEAKRMPLLSGAWLLQVGQLRTSTKIQWYIYTPSFLCADPGRLGSYLFTNVMHFLRLQNSSFKKNPATFKPKASVRLSIRVLHGVRLCFLGPHS